MSDQLALEDRLKKYQEGWIKHQAEGKKVSRQPRVDSQG